MTQFPQELLNIPLSPDFTDRERQTIATASLISLLTYSDEPSAELQKKEAQHGILSPNTVTKLWVLENTNRGTIIAWSARLNTCFVAFRGSSSLHDWYGTNLQAATTFDEANNWGVHEGFQSRAAGLPMAVISLLIRRYNTVICGHSLGGAMATLAGLAIPSHILGSNPKNAWSDSDKATSRVSVITFAAPSVLIKNHRERAEPSRKLRSLFHNVIDPNDIVPTVFNRAKECVRGLADALQAPGVQPAFSSVSLQTAFRLFRLSSNNLDTGVLAGGVVDLLIVVLRFALRLNAPNEVSYGAHVGSVILLQGQNSFIRMCEVNKDLCLDALARPIDLGLPNAAQSFANRHSMVSYAAKWETFATASADRLWTAQQEQAANAIVDDIVPPRTEILGQAIQNPRDQSVEFSIKFDDIRARHAFSHALLHFPGPTAQRGEFRRAELVFIDTETVEIRFSFSIHTQTENSSTGLDELWEALFRASNQLTLVDIFGRKHPIMLRGGVTCPDLTTTRHQSTTDFIKTAILRAVALQVAFVHEQSSGEDQTDICPDVKPVVQLIDDAITSADPKRFLERLKHTFGSVESAWSSVDMSDWRYGLQHGNTNTEQLLEIREELNKFLPDTAKGPLRRDLADLVDGVVGTPRPEGHNPIDAWNPPLLSQTLLSYTRSITTPVPDATEDPSFDLRTKLLTMSLLINTQLNADCDDLLTALRPSVLRRCLAVAGVAAGVGAAVLFPALWATVAGVGTAVYSGRSLYPRLARPELAYNQLLTTAMEQLGVSEPRPTTTASAEVALGSFCGMSVEAIKKRATTGRSSWPEGFEPSDAFYIWIQHVSLIGKLRTLLSIKPAVGTFGPIRSGKSELLTGVFRLPDSVFKPGEFGDHRTSQLRIKVTSTALVADGPGLDEGDIRLHEASSLVVDLLDVIIIVIDIRLAEAQSANLLLRTLAQLLKRRNGQPVCILLNRVDVAITDRVIEHPDDWLINVRNQKLAFIRHLRQALGGVDNLDIIASTPRSGPTGLTASAHRYVRRATIPLEDMVHVSCLLDLEKSATLRPKQAVLKALRSQGDLWGIRDVQAWLRDVCPEAVPEF